LPCFAATITCGPDSFFSLHFAASIFRGKPYDAVIETDGHAGDAGTRTRWNFLVLRSSDSATGRPSLQRPGNNCGF
jgi:hypothetical protein